MRARNIKPSLFKNELLGVSDPLFTVIFEGLWCLADREGRLEDRPMRIHVEVNPYRDGAGTVRALDWLVLNGFVQRYSVEGRDFLSIVNFCKHQQPHIKEAESKIPSPSNQGVVEAPDKHRTSTVLAALIPDSGFPLSDSGFLNPDTGVKARKAVPSEPEEFKTLVSIYPKRAGANPRGRALRAANARITEGASWEEMIEGARRYQAYIRATGKEGTEFVRQLSTFVGPDRSYLDPWALPATKAQSQQDSNVAASMAWLERDNATAG